MPLFKKKSKHGLLMETYTFGDKLGEGAFSTVVKVTGKQDGVDYAVKIIDKAKMKGKNQSVEQEIEILRSLDHDNIVKLIEFMEDKKTIYLVMTLITGGELFDRIIKVEFFSEKSASVLVQQILSAVRYLHSKGIAHRDLKPENLLMLNHSDDAPVILSDFGLSCYVTDAQAMRQTCGTPGYVAPEVLMRKQYNEKVDCWSIGVITFILLCGYPPFYHEQDKMLFELIKRAEFEYDSPDWDKVSQNARDFINHLLELNPNKRLSCQQALDHPWVKTESDVDLSNKVKENLKAFMAKNRWKKAFNVHVALLRMQDNLAGLSAAPAAAPQSNQSEEDSSSEDEQEEQKTKDQK